MPYCQNCGAHVTPAYVRTMSPDGEDSVRTCPRNDCRLIREGSEVREARSKGFSKKQYDRYNKDPNHKSPWRQDVK